MKISAIIISKNEQEKIKDCIQSLSFLDEIIVIDNMSTDNTLKIAQKAGAKIFQVKGLDFSYLRNIGKEQARNPWLLYIDADERISSQLKKNIINRVNKTKYNAFRLNRRNYFFGHSWPKQEKIIRLIKKEALIGWHGSLHETPLVAGSVGEMQGSLDHYTHDDLTRMIAKTNQWSDIEAHLRFMNDHPYITPWRFLHVMTFSWWKVFVKEEGWKAGEIGIVESLYQVFSIFISYAKLWELQNKSKIGSKNEKI